MRPTVRPLRRPAPYRLLGALLWLAMSLAWWREPLSRAAVTGPVGLLVLLTGTGRFTRMLTDRPWAPVLGLFAVAWLWGGHLAGPPAGVGAAGGGPAPPSAFAVGLTLWAWAATGSRAGAVRCRVRYVGPGGLRSPWGYVWLGTLYALIALLDPVTFAVAAVGAAVLVAGWEREGRAVAGRWALTAVAPVTALWLRRSVGVLPADGGPATDLLREPLRQGTSGHVWLVLIGLPALLLAAWRSKRALGQR
ncbi:MULTISPECIES: hypothetical protein [Streptomyces]|uniref:hypothetical protein n=1 Tax=Streptomyces TaxID=1883 RepID=UPI00211A95A3|nr:hypothetical protein [Streptomyces hilarionis]MCQ9133757.1 hypothetical protein [Streptomyces hilarionis]